MKISIKEGLMITLATFMIATAVYLFLIPSGLAIASVSGIAVVLAQLFPLSVSTITFIINIICLILGYFLLGGEFSGKTAYVSVMLPVFIRCYEFLWPDYTYIMEEISLNMLCVLLLVAGGCAILFNNNASSGGLDILYKVMNRYFYIDIGQANSIVGVLIALLSFLTADLKIVVLSIVGSYLTGVFVDYFIFQTDQRRRVSIISDKYDEIQQYVLYELKSGATLYPINGAYTMKDMVELVVCVTKDEYPKLMAYIGKVDPDAFVTIYNVKAAFYKEKNIKG